jgi:hypothetical protein
MVYPVKNLRLKFIKKSDYPTVYEGSVPVEIVCFKADFMDSSSSHNTCTGNLVYDLYKNMGLKTPPQMFGGKYDIVNHDGAAFVAFNKEFKNEAELILQTLYDGKEIVVNGALGKNGLQMFTEVAVKTDNTVTGNDKVTGQLGLSYVFNQGKKWSNNK